MSSNNASSSSVASAARHGDDDMKVAASAASSSSVTFEAAGNEKRFRLIETVMSCEAIDLDTQIAIARLIKQPDLDIGKSTSIRDALVSGKQLTTELVQLFPTFHGVLESAKTYHGAHRMTSRVIEGDVQTKLKSLVTGIKATLSGAKRLAKPDGMDEPDEQRFNFLMHNLEAALAGSEEIVSLVQKAVEKFNTDFDGSDKNMNSLHQVWLLVKDKIGYSGKNVDAIADHFGRTVPILNAAIKDAHELEGNVKS